MQANKCYRKNTPEFELGNIDVILRNNLEFAQFRFKLEFIRK